MDKSAFIYEFEPLMEFFAEKTKNVEKPLKLAHAFAEYKALRNLSCSPNYLRLCFRQQLAPNIHRFVEFDDETKVKVIFGTSSAIDDEFLTELRKNSVIEVDGDGRIIKYASRTLQLEGKHILSSVNNSKYKFRHKYSPPYITNDEESYSSVDVKSELLNQPIYYSQSVKTEPSEPRIVTSSLSPNLTEPTFSFSSSGEGPTNLVPQEPDPSPNSSTLPSIEKDQLEREEENLLNSIGNFMTTFSGFMDAQMQFVDSKRRTNFQTSQTSDQTKHQTASESCSSQMCPTIRQFLHHLQMITQNIESDHLSEVKCRISSRIQQSVSEKELTPSMLRLTIFSMLSILKDNKIICESDFGSTNAKKFLSLIEMYIDARNAPLLSKQHEDLKKTISSTNEEETYSCEQVRMALEAAMTVLFSDKPVRFAC